MNMKRSQSNKTTTRKTAAPPAAVTTAQARSLATAAEPPATTIEAKIDVGFGNNLFLRGQGANLSWERGTPLTCVGPNTWRWSARVTDDLTFKLLLNDRNWAVGENIVVRPGAQVEIAPKF
jgi:hypothetical protein